MNEYCKLIFVTQGDANIAIIRILAGIIIFPYGLQKVFVCYDWWGIKGTVDQMKIRHIPLLISYLIIIGQFFGSIALITGFMGRIAALGNFIIFFGALLTHLGDGWMMNWFNKKKGEGIEYFVILLTLLVLVILNGSGAWSLDRMIMANY